ncbi:hypothetical protein D9M72_371220 [compost metagenome]
MELHVDGTAANEFADLVIRGHVAFEIGFHRSFVDLDNGLDQLFAIFFGLVLQVVRDFDNVPLSAEGLVAPDEGVHLDQIDNALEFGFSADRQLHDDSRCTETGLDHLDRAVEVGAGLVHLVAEDHARNIVLLSLTPDGFRLRLNTGVGVEKRNSTVENAQRTLDFDGEVNVAGGVDDVEAAGLAVTTLPEGGRGSRGDGDAAFLLLLHPVHGRSAVVDFADLMGLAGVVQDALSRRGLASVDVRHNTEITVVFDFVFACHSGLPLETFAPELPAIMRERTVGISHLVRVFALLHGATTVVRCVHEFAAQAINHGRFVTLACGRNQPTDGEGLATLRTNIDRNLVSCTTDAARTHFNVRRDVVERRVEYGDRLLLELDLNRIERAVDNAFRNRLLAVQHDGVHELRDNQITELRIRIDLALFCFMTSGHTSRLFKLFQRFTTRRTSRSAGIFKTELLRTLRTILRTTLLAVLDALRIENTTDDVVTNARKVLNAAAADHDNRVFLKVVTFTRNVADDFEAVRQTNLGNLTESRVRLLRGRRVNAGANATLLRVFLQSRNLIALYLCLTRLADQLVYGRHIPIPCKILSRYPCGRIVAVAGSFERLMKCAKQGPIRLSADGPK